jgi:pimeloyl-ACP methyl ester carboxylesterase
VPGGAPSKLANASLAVQIPRPQPRREIRAMPRASINGVELHFEDTGPSGKPALLLIAGLGATGHIWGPLPRRLRSAFRVIAFDHRHIGRSGGNGAHGGIAFSDLVGDALGLLDHLEIPRAHVLGKSLGGMIAQRMALDHPERVERLVLVASTARITPYLYRIGEFFYHLSMNLSPQDYLHTVFTFCFSPAFHDANFHSTLKTEAALAEALGDVRSVAEHVKAFRDLDFREELAGLHIPTLVIGGGQDHLIPPAQHRELAEAIPGAELIELPEVGHSPMRETGLPIVEKIVRFLLSAEVEERVAAEG